MPEMDDEYTYHYRRADHYGEGDGADPAMAQVHATLAVGAALRDIWLLMRESQVMT